MKIILYGVISTCVVASLALYVWSISRLPDRLEMYVFDTKGKPSVFIRTPTDTRILIDGGANGDIVRDLTRILPFYSRRIDTVIVTKDDPNTVTGLIDVISRYTVGSITIPKITARQLNLGSSTDQIYETFLDTAEQLKIPVKEVLAGDKLVLDGKNKSSNKLTPSIQLKAEILFPVSTTSEFKYSKASPPEVVMRISYGNTSFLLIGDVSLKIQKFITNSTSTLAGITTNLLSDVLIVPHAISSASIATDLINVIKPKSIIYSQTLSKASSNTKSNKADPLYMILDSNRFNIKQKSTITVLSDGESVNII